MPFKPHPTDPDSVIYSTGEFVVPKPWVGLTDEEINKSWEWAQRSPPFLLTRIKVFAIALEAKLREKNS